MKTRAMLYPFAMFIIIAIFSIESFAQINWVAATDSSGKTFHVSFNEKTGTAKHILGLPVNFSCYGDISRQNVEDLSREFLDEYAGFTKIKPSDLRMVKAVNNKGKWYIKFQQLYSGVPVYRAFIGFTVGETGKIIVLGSDAHPDISIDAAPSVSSNEAMKIANSHVQD